MCAHVPVGDVTLWSPGQFVEKHLLHWDTASWENCGGPCWGPRGQAVWPATVIRVTAVFFFWLTCGRYSSWARDLIQATTDTYTTAGALIYCTQQGWNLHPSDPEMMMIHCTTGWLLFTVLFFLLNRTVIWTTLAARMGKNTWLSEMLKGVGLVIYSLLEN